MNIIEYWAEHPTDTWRQATRLEINGKIIYEMVDGEPEDNLLARNFSFSPKELLTLSHKAGLMGEVLNYEVKTISWDEFFGE